MAEAVRRERVPSVGFVRTYRSISRGEVKVGVIRLLDQRCCRGLKHIAC